MNLDFKVTFIIKQIIENCIINNPKINDLVSHSIDLRIYKIVQIEEDWAICKLPDGTTRIFPLDELIDCQRAIRIIESIVVNDVFDNFN